MATGPQAFYCLWQEDRIRESLFELLSNEDICSVRLANSACCNLVTRRLFKRTHLTFTANTFTKSSRVQALSRIGHHIEHLTFYIAHSEATFLPPLIHPLTGREINFLYTPHTCMASVLTRPKYANTELGGILTQQYPPLFHAATNVPSFLNALKHMTNIRHLTIKCPGQDPKERYRRSIVDYALISLRISVERCPLHKLSKLSLSGVHPAAFNYLRHVPGFGSHPSAARRWRQIRKLYVSVDTWDFYGPSPGLDHLKIIDDYVRNMTPHLEKLSFTWLDGNGDGIFPKGPCPVALSGDALFVPFCDGDSKKLFNEITGPMSPLPPAPRREPMQFARLRSLRLRNCTMNTPQLRDLVERHKKMIREFDFENVSLADGGSYEEAFAELLNQVSDRGSNVWSRSGPSGSDRSRSGIGSGQDSDGTSQRDDIVPPSGDSRHPYPSHLSHLSFRLAAGSHMGSVADDWPTVRHGPAAVATPDDVQLSSPSAAVTAASRELLDIDTDGLENHQSLVSELPFVMNKLSDVFETGHDAKEFLRTPPPPPIHEEDEEEQEEEGEAEWGEREEDEQEQDEQEWAHVIPEQRSRDRDEDGLASDIATAQEESLTFTTRLKKKHDKPRRRKHHHHRRHDDGRGRELEAHDHDIGRSASRRHHHHHHHHHQNDRHQQGRGSASRSRSRSRASHGRRHRNHRSRSRKSPLSAASLQADATQQTPPPPVPALVAQHHPSARCASPTAGVVPSQHSPSWLAAIGIVGDHHRVYSLGRKNSSKSGNSHRSADEEISQPQFAPGVPSPRVASATVAPLNIPAPVLDIDPHTVLLQPAVYDPNTTLSPPASLERKGSYVSSYSVASSPPVRPPQPLLVRHPSAAAKNGDGLSSVQRHVLQDQQQQQQQQKDADDAAAEQRAAQQRRRLMMAEDVDARTWALKKAKEAVLAKLSREFQQRMDREATQRSAAATATTAAVAAAAVSGPPLPHGWMGLGSSARSGNNSNSHIMSASAALSLLTGGGGGGGGLRLRDRLFGEPLSLVHGSGGGTDGGGRYGLADMPPVSPSMAAAAALDYRYQHHSMESSQSAVVPLIFSLA